MKTIETARREIAEYIDYYLTERKHSALGYLTPHQFEQLRHLRLDPRKRQQPHGRTTRHFA